MSSPLGLKTNENHRGIAHLWHLARTNTRYVLEYNLLFGVDVGVIFYRRAAFELSVSVEQHALRGVLGVASRCGCADVRIQSFDPGPRWQLRRHSAPSKLIKALTFEDILVLLALLKSPVKLKGVMITPADCELEAAMEVTSRVLDMCNTTLPILPGQFPKKYNPFPKVWRELPGVLE